MKCRSLRDAIVELGRGGDAGPGTLAAVESHVEHCAACAALMARERQLSQGLRALAAATAADGPSAALGRRLLEIFAERQSTPRRTVVRLAAGWMRAAAAVLLTGAAVAWWWSARGEPAAESSMNTHAVRADASKPEPAPAPGVALSGDSQSATSVVARSRRPRAARQAVSAAPIVRPAGFVALPGAAGLPDFESGQIIRMEIPVTSLPNYGIEILPEAQGSPVQADLLVGQDGQARAIRLVTTSGSHDDD